LLELLVFCDAPIGRKRVGGTNKWIYVHVRMFNGKNANSSPRLLEAGGLMGTL
jgi:hypothetical protein